MGSCVGRITKGHDAVLKTLSLPAWIKGRNIRGKLAAVDVERYWQENGRQAHHALHDARANRFAFMCSIEATQDDARTSPGV